MKITCYLVDDKKDTFELFGHYAKLIPEVDIIGTETDAVKAALDLKEGRIQADITFLDIEMPGISGFELAEMVKGLTHIVFTTGHREYGADAFEYGAIDYLQKPVSFQRFRTSIEKARALMATAQSSKATHVPHFIFIPGDGKGMYIKIWPSDIIYIRSDSNYLHFYLERDKHVMSYMTMEGISRSLPPGLFYRVHKSFIVNMAMVDKVDPRTVYMVDGSEIPLGKTYKQDFLDQVRR